MRNIDEVRAYNEINNPLFSSWSKEEQDKFIAKLWAAISKKQRGGR